MSIARQAANLATSTVEVKVDGDDWHIKTVSTFKNSELKFKLGEEFEEERQDGVKGNWKDKLELLIDVQWWTEILLCMLFDN